MREAHFVHEHSSGRPPVVGVIMSAGKENPAFRPRNQGTRDLDRTAVPDGVFCYTFFKAIATT